MLSWYPGGLHCLLLIGFDIVDEVIGVDLGQFAVSLLDEARLRQETVQE